MTLKASNYPTIRPSLDLNFSQTKRLDPRITFSRASAGTYFDANGVLQSAPAGVARFDHNPVSGESLGLLLEEARTNYIGNSDFSSTAAVFQNPILNTWSANPAQISISSSSVVAPNGSNVVKLVNLAGYSGDGNTNSAHETVAIANTAFAAPQCYSMFVKAGELSSICFRIGGAGSTRGAVAFDLANRQAKIVNSTFSIQSVEIREAGNGWIRCIVYASHFSSAQTFGVIPLNNYANVTFSGDGVSGLYVWGAQLEQASSPTSYIPTVASTVTRAADVCTVTNSNIYDTDSFTIINQPFGASGGGSTLNLFDGPEPIKRATVYSTDLSQATINTAAGKTDEFWRWRVLGSSFALPNFATDGQVTVDWGDGTIETLTTAGHTFSPGGGYHDIGFRLDSGTYFRPYINDNASHDTKVVALGPAPESMKLNALLAFAGCSNLEAFDATVDATGGTDFTAAWYGCSSLTSFPLIDTSSGTNFIYAWENCSSLTSFPLIDTAAGTNFGAPWRGCSSLTSFPLINTAAGTSFSGTWQNCTSLTSFPEINTAAGTIFISAWYNCSSLTSFPLINTAAGTNFFQAWRNCSSLTSFPLIDTASVTSFSSAWYGCSSLTSFPLINTAAGTNFGEAWRGCFSLTSFPLINTAAGTSFFAAWLDCSSLTSFPLISTAAGTNFYAAWRGCSSLTDFPANFFDSWTGTPANSCFVQAWDFCSALTATSVENILNSIDTSGQSAPASGVDITIDYNAGTGTPSVATAITNLKSRGWTITLNGVLQ